MPGAIDVHGNWLVANAMLLHRVARRAATATNDAGWETKRVPAVQLPGLMVATYVRGVRGTKSEGGETVRRAVGGLQ